MRKIMIFGIVLLSLVTFFGWGMGEVSAQCLDFCATNCLWEQADGSCGEWEHVCCDEDNSGSANCDAGYYLNNNGCTPIGTEEEECFPAGTKIEMSDGGQKNIEDVKIGDTVVSQDEWGRRASSTVTQLIQPISDNMCRIEFEDGDKLEVTKSHPLMTDTGWKAIDVGAAAKEKESVPVTKLEVGDRMVKVDGTNPVVSEIACWDEQVQTYNLTVDNDHTYFAGGYLAHNKGGIGRGACIAPQNVNCPANTACVPGNNLYCSTYNVNYNSSTTTGFDGPAGNEGCQLGNAQTSSRRCNPWFCGYDVTTYTCCPAGTVSTYSYSYETYTILKYPDASAYNCYPDAFISSVQSSYYGGTHRVCEGEDGGKPCGQRAWYYMLTTCRKRITTYTCRALCPRPTAPGLVSPHNGDQLSSTSVGLQWNASNFGTGCSGTYTVYIGTSNPPTSSIYLGTNTSVNLTNLTRGSTYYWYVQAVNSGQTANSGVRSFTILNDQITGQVFYDPTNTCSGSGWSSGGVSVSLDGGAGTAVSGTGTLVV